jgi:hypothetical protein
VCGRLAPGLGVLQFKGLPLSEGPFLEDLASALNPDHGTVVANFHGGRRVAPSLRGLLLAVAGRAEPGPGFDPATADGAAVLRAARNFRCE